uniref:ATP synthase F0 subunit 8 n=1 Tax=Tonoscolex birmanicus TaxID=1405561 RepID=U3QY25_9ANNE|nr:ATP synthase F0 subunit 8 [Tonoscolex birmanicus]AGW95951.1 ATP synthase F0 subunit 8 [Tonoscolex birmanicus]
MPHLSPMSWLTAILTFWLVLMLFTSNIWWANTYLFETDTSSKHCQPHTQWQWS